MHRTRAVGYPKPRQHSKGRFLHYGQWIGEKPPSAKQRVRLAVLAALEKKPTDFADFLRLMEESGFAVKHGRGGVISFLASGQEKPTRLRASTLGVGFDPEDIKAVIAGERPLPELPEEPTVPPRRVNLIIDIQERMAQGKGPAYERWAKVYNLKQMAAALQYLQEHHLTDYAALTASTEAAVDHFHKLSDELRTTEEALSKTSELMAATVDYAKTRPVGNGIDLQRFKRRDTGLVIGVEVQLRVKRLQTKAAGVQHIVGFQISLALDLLCHVYKTDP